MHTDNDKSHSQVLHTQMIVKNLVDIAVHDHTVSLHSYSKNKIL